MSKYCFSLSGADARRDGVIESDSFRGAVDALAEQVDVHMGDVLEIGVYGFPPARYECVGELLGEVERAPVWMPAGPLAA